MKKLLSVLLSAFLSLCLIVGVLPLTINAVSADPKLLVAPYEMTATLLPSDDGLPYGAVELLFRVDNMPFLEGDGTIPSSLWIEIERKTGENGIWDFYFHNPTDSFGDGTGFTKPSTYMTQDIFTDEYDGKLMGYRVRMVTYSDSFDVTAASAWSNTAYLGIKVSTWAAVEVGRAMSYGLIPDSIANNLTGPITREEFAELATRLYEVYSGKTAVPAPVSTFKDCINPDVLKAFGLGIVNGVGGGKFSPKVLTNREQIAAMLNRAVKSIAPNADFSITGAPVFKDAMSIASYFQDNVKFMSKNGFIKGSNDNFNPKGTCSREMAVMIAVRVYEHYKAN